MKFKGVFTDEQGVYSLGPFFMSDVRKMSNYLMDDRHKLSRDDGIKDLRVFLTSRVRSRDTLFFAGRKMKKVLVYAAFDPISYGGLALIHGNTHPDTTYEDFVNITRLQVRYGFEKMGLLKITATPTRQNLPALKVVKELGFIKEGLLKKHRFIDGKAYDVVVLSLFKEE